VVVVEILGVVNDVTPVPPVNTAPPDAAAYQSIVSSEPAVADRLKVPVPHLESPVPPVGAEGNTFTIFVMLLEIAGEPEAQAADEVIITETTSLLANAVVV
jgi:hypothetical protein